MLCVGVQGKMQMLYTYSLYSALFSVSCIYIYIYIYICIFYRLNYIFYLFLARIEDRCDEDDWHIAQNG
jgi:hypothetical protein